ncbi:Surfactin synthase thioesterase subunit [Micromonospora matsumotoense]|uniref:Surfactin synthase thioesterase subunit n=1 Tax=Micromonospora matsumotoense TaxID=121616 RepID=A0A1C4ZQV9_9ACTN|nr:alpha/beta fold hydrolase [Micromonospora matsumotoense]SCF35272.1 Surfactin synthase thioesterase subunit [Micromonospora matsumotoense]
MTDTVSGNLGASGAGDRRASPSDDHVLWLRRFHPAPDAAVRLLLCPHSGGSAGYFRALSGVLSPVVEAVAVQYPGRQDRRAEPLIDDLRELAARVVDVLADEPGPVALFGHSMGALLAFELARRLEHGGREVAGLFVSGARAPSLLGNEGLHLVDDAELLRVVRSLNGTDAELLDDEEIVQAALPLVRNDTRAVETYGYQGTTVPDLRCPIVALVGTEDPRVAVAEAEKWRDHTSGPFTLHTFPGGHFYLNSYTTALGRLMTVLLTGMTDD